MTKKHLIKSTTLIVLLIFILLATSCTKTKVTDPVTTVEPLQEAIPVITENDVDLTEKEPSTEEVAPEAPVIEASPALTERDYEILQMTSLEVVTDMGNGWNLANTMESVADWVSGASPTEFETAWGQPVTAKRMIDSLKASGFNSVRIPVAWSNMMADDGTYQISELYFRRIDQIISYVIDNDMYAIVNIHWDGGWWEDFGSADEATRNEAMVRYTLMWEQIAEHYKDYPYLLILESANEELGNASKGNHTEDIGYETVIEINQQFVNLVRSTGSFNKNRHLLIAGYNTDIDMTCDDRYHMPTDTVENKLLISVHYYTPPTFCIASEKTNSWGYMDSWGTPDDISLMATYFSKMKKFSDAGYGVIIGEYGVTKKKEDGKEIMKEGTEAFISHVVTLTKENGFCAMLWDTGMVYNRRSGQMESETFAKIFQ